MFCRTSATQSVVRRLRCGVVGGGFIAQLVHLPTLGQLGDRFEVVALADPSGAIRAEMTKRYRIPAAYENHTAMLAAEALDALFVFSPAVTHVDIIRAALQSDVHVFTEKPMCISSVDAHELAERSHERGVVLQVGYMKQHDPAYQALLVDVAQRGEDVRLIEFVTHDPGLERFFSPPGFVAAGPAEDQAHREFMRSRTAQLSSAFPGRELTERDESVYVTLFTDTLVHDVNLLHGVLRSLGDRGEPAIATAASWAGGRVMQGILRLSNGARCTLNLLEAPGLASFGEQLRVFFDDAIHLVSFPAPYERHAPTLYEVVRAEGDQASEKQRRSSYREPFIDELVHFHACVTQGTECRTPPEQAVRDLRLLERLFIATLDHGPAGGGEPQFGSTRPD